MVENGYPRVKPILYCLQDSFMDDNLKSEFQLSSIVSLKTFAKENPMKNKFG